MTRITREQFVADLKRDDSDVAIDVNHLTPATGKKLENAGITKGDLAEIAGDDGKINKDQEYIALYNKVDSFEKNNSSSEYFNTTDAKNALTTSGEAYEALKSQLDFNRAKSILHGPHPSKANAKPMAEGQKVSLFDDEEKKGRDPRTEQQKLGSPPKGYLTRPAEVLQMQMGRLSNLLKDPYVKAGFKVGQTIEQLERQKQAAKTPEEKKSIEIVQGQLTDVQDHLAKRHGETWKKLQEFSDAILKQKLEEIMDASAKPQRINGEPEARPLTDLRDESDRQGMFIPPMVQEKIDRDLRTKHQKVGVPPKDSEASRTQQLHMQMAGLAAMGNNPLVQASVKVRETIEQLEQQKQAAKTPEEKKSIEIVQGHLPMCRFTSQNVTVRLGKNWRNL